MPVEIKQCSCENPFQDKTYGKNQRVFNTCKEGKEGTCTSCGKNIKLSGETTKKP